MVLLNDAMHGACDWFTTHHKVQAPTGWIGEVTTTDFS
jgi:hypothetical protein